MGAIDFSINEALLGRLAELLNTEIFFETGTFKGQSLQAARRLIPRCISVEMADSLFQQAKQMFADDDSISLFQGDSPDIIAQHCDELQAHRVVFWLDAHWCTNDQSAGSESQSPLLGELRAIKQLHPSSVVMIDDARLYAATPPPPHRYTDWPTFDEVLKALMALSDNHRLMILNDVIFFYPRAIEADVAAYASVQGVNWRHIARDARKYARVRKILNFWRSPKR